MSIKPILVTEGRLLEPFGGSRCFIPFITGSQDDVRSQGAGAGVEVGGAQNPEQRLMAIEDVGPVLRPQRVVLKLRQPDQQRVSRVKISGRAVRSVLKENPRMGRPPVIPAEKKTRIVLSVLAGEMTIAEAARREKISEQSIGRWKADFLEAGKTAVAAGRSGPSTREQQLEAEVADLTQALGEAAVELRVWKKSAEGRLGPSRTSR
ncbi:MAG: transposase [Actinophytocola sp.]|uniref:transposase n=1 Tax=Actinophytocola sp. TaxID=1872138 RepID=UPI003D6B7134